MYKKFNLIALIAENYYFQYVQYSIKMIFFVDIKVYNFLTKRK